MLKCNHVAPVTKRISSSNCLLSVKMHLAWAYHIKRREWEGASTFTRISFLLWTWVEVSASRVGRPNCLPSVRWLARLLCRSPPPKPIHGFAHVLVAASSIRSATPPPQPWSLSVPRVLRTKPPPTRPPRPTHPQQPTRMSWAVAIGPVWPAVRPARAAPVTTWAAVALHRSTVVSYLRSALPRIQGNFFHHNPRSFVEPRIKALRFESLLALYIQLSVLLTTVNFNEGPNVRFGLYSKFLLVLN